MGMAASQARFLGLTARKSNVEFQGQQINQERTALTNEVMGLYNKYSQLAVPVAPSKYDYVKQTYSIQSSYETYEMTDFSKITEGDYVGYYNVTLTCDEEIPSAYCDTLRDINVTRTKDKNGNYSYLDFIIGTEKFVYDENDEKNSSIKKITGDYSKYPGLSVIMESQGLDPSDTGLNKIYYAFECNDKTYYVSQSDLDDMEFQTEDGKEMYYGDYTFDYQGTHTEPKEIQAIASLKQETNGRMSAINILKCDDDKDLENRQYAVKTGQSDDEDGYMDAMNQYNYEKDKYEQKLKELNAQIEKIQTQDKALEMKLRQLDTEQEALKTEMDSISKVINDTVDKLFESSK